MANTAAVVVVLKPSPSLVCYQTTRPTVDFGNGRAHLAHKCVTLAIFLKRLAVRVSIRRFKKQLATIIKRRQSFVQLNYIKVKDSSPFSGCIIEEGIDYEGSNILEKPVESQKACSDLCASTAGGLFWTWAPSGVCHVKNSDSGWKDLKWMEKGFASGNRQCGAGGMYFLLYDMPCGLIFRLACGSFVSL